MLWMDHSGGPLRRDGVRSCFEPLFGERDKESFVPAPIP